MTQEDSVVDSQQRHTIVGCTSASSQINFATSPTESDKSSQSPFSVTNNRLDCHVSLDVLDHSCVPHICLLRKCPCCRGESRQPIVRNLDVNHRQAIHFIRNHNYLLVGQGCPAGISSLFLLSGREDSLDAETMFSQRGGSWQMVANSILQMRSIVTFRTMKSTITSTGLGAMSPT
jgi:hypothetical protein